MNEYKFEDLFIGQKAAFQETIRPELLWDFYRTTGDNNPLHLKDDYASMTPFKKRVVYGLLVQSFISRLVGVELPGKYCLIVSIQSDFKNPCFIGDHLTIEGEVIEKSNATKIVKIRTEITNQNKEVLIEGHIKVRLLK